tara:strand:- start:384 stop:1469 length:1086 start_codon:yes stop_codon:yes gene_type:complete
MNKILNNYLIFGYFKIVFNTILIFISLGIVLNLFEEIEFFKNLNESLQLPIVLSLSFVPNLVIELLPFIIFISSMWFFSSIRSNTDLLSAKIFGFSNLKITLMTSVAAFAFGFLILFAINPITSALVKYYEETKAQYSKDVDHLISINKNGVWIKEIGASGSNIISAKKLDNEKLNSLSIYIFNDNNQMTNRIEANSADISSNPWIIEKAKIYNFTNNDVIENEINYEFETTYTLEKINSLYKNLNTVSFLSLITEYEILNEMGYSKKILNEKINKFISLPFFLAIMVILAALFTIGSLKRDQNFYVIIVSIITCVIVYYFKDLSLALGQTSRISITLSVWMPILAIALFTSIGIIQINEK